MEAVAAAPDSPRACSLHSLHSVEGRRLPGAGTAAAPLAPETTPSESR